MPHSVDVTFGTVGTVFKDCLGDLGIAAAQPTQHTQDLTPFLSLC